MNLSILTLDTLNTSIVPAITCFSFRFNAESMTIINKAIRFARFLNCAKHCSKNFKRTIRYKLDIETC